MSMNSASTTRNPHQWFQGRLPVMKVLAWLLITICIGCVGSFPFMQHFLSHFVTHHSTTSLSVAHLAETSQDRNLQQMLIHVQAHPSSSNSNVLPTAWLSAKRTEVDLAYAQESASSFVVAYQTVDALQPQSLEACVSMLTSGAMHRFYGDESGLKANIRMSANWRSQAKQERLHQVALSGMPYLLAASYINGNILAWLVVPYQLTSQKNGQVTIEHDVYTVLLLGVPFDMKGLGTGWQISSWQSGMFPFAPPSPL